MNRDHHAVTADLDRLAELVQDSRIRGPRAARRIVERAQATPEAPRRHSDMSEGPQRLLSDSGGPHQAHQAHQAHIDQVLDGLHDQVLDREDRDP